MNAAAYTRLLDLSGRARAVSLCYFQHRCGREGTPMDLPLFSIGSAD